MKRFAKILFWAATALSAICCERVSSDNFPSEPVVDSTTFRIGLKSDYPIIDAQILVYKDDGAKSLEALIRTDTTLVEYDGPTGGKILVAVANSVRKLNAAALGTFDSAEQLVYLYPEEKPGQPLLSASSWVESGSDTELELTPLLCAVSIAKVTNYLDNYRRLEDPRIYLRNASSSAEIMKESGFYPVETFSDTTGLRGLMWERLPYDVGMYPQSPGTTLKFYPNSSETSRTTLVFECEIKSETVRYEAALPSSARARKFKAELTVREKNDFSFSIY